MRLLLKNVLFTLLVPGTVAICVPLLLAAGLIPASAPWLLPSFACWLLGGSIYAWCVWDFATFGRGTPLPLDAPEHLVVRGLYQYSRNPMYVGVICVILGWAVRYRSLRLVGYAVCVGVLFQCFIVFYEEPHLQRLFGRPYAEYRARVGRWLLR